MKGRRKAIGNEEKERLKTDERKRRRTEG